MYDATTDICGYKGKRSIDSSSTSEIHDAVSTHLITNDSVSDSCVDRLTHSVRVGDDSDTISYADTSYILPNPDYSSPTPAGIEHRGRVSSNVYFTQGGTTYWVPEVSNDIKPVVGKEYDNWDDIVSMYNVYAEASGFCTRLGTIKKSKLGMITHRYIHCNKASKPHFQHFDSSNSTAVRKKRRTRFKVTNCKACIRLRAIPGTSKYCIYGFIEHHNHALVDQHNMEFTKRKRKLGYLDHQFIHKMSLNKIGATISHRLQCSLRGGSENVRGTKNDYKNAARDIRIFIGERDAQMIVNTLEAKKQYSPNFFFEYVVVGHELRSLFWADDISLCNYASFGDVVGFDATYQTNKYNMIFVPFTGVDHHKKCVTFGAGLLYDETKESYIWLLTQFLKAHKKQPLLILTDQDASMKKAISVVFDKSIHRLCMWHIVRKIPAKISSDVLENHDVRKSIHKLVWNVFITPSEFEERWKNLMVDLKLSDNSWLKEIYDIRERWVPCYFRDVQMCCLMKTTSRCESSNALFKIRSSGTDTLVEFLLCFDITIYEQRQKQRAAEFESNTTIPSMPKNAPLERHALELYTGTIFLEVQKEIYRGFDQCYIVCRNEVDGVKYYDVAHTNKCFKVVNEFKVTLDVRAETVSCTCMGFTRTGYLCRHVFCVFRYNEIEKIPVRYQYDRWGRNALPSRVYDAADRSTTNNDPDLKIRNKISDMIDQCTTRLRRKPDKLAALFTQIREIRDRVYEEFPVDPACNKKSAFLSDILGQPEIVDVTINPPQGIRNKGCGTNSRLIGPGEKAVDTPVKKKAVDTPVKKKAVDTPVKKKAVDNRKKRIHLCNTCKEYVDDHDSRNCAKVRAAKAAAAAKAAELVAKATANANDVDSASAGDNASGSGTGH